VNSHQHWQGFTGKETGIREIKPEKAAYRAYFKWLVSELKAQKSAAGSRFLPCARPHAAVACAHGVTP
jgi:hypothetical protein